MSRKRAAARGGVSTARKGFRLVGEVNDQPLGFVLKPGQNTVGALPANDLVVNVSGVSDRHTRFTWSDDEIRVEDLESRDGTFVNGVRIEEALLKIGDVVCFGPAIMHLQPLETDGAKPPIRLPPKQPNRRERAHRPARVPTSTGAGEEIAERWVGALDRVGDILLGDRTLGVAKALEVLISTLGVGGAAFLEWDRSAETTVVLHTAGDFRPPADLDMMPKQLAAARPKPEDQLTVTNHCAEGDPPAALAVASDAFSRVRAVVVLGEFHQRKACGRFLEMFLKLVLRSLPDAAPAEPARLRRPVRDLIFPQGYVVGRSDAMMSVYHQLRHLLVGDLPVLITGETGVGKELIARILHSSSPRSTGPFVAVNCAALPADLLEAELFGIESGVATGVSKRDGKMQIAAGGVVFLDEIGDMSPALQAKLLRALQEKEVHPVGARRPVPLDVRVLAATNTDLQERIAEGRFRSDLYFRIAGYTLNVPPLRGRRGDIAALIEFMIGRVAIEIDKPVRGISVKALQALADAPWLGNVRELEHEVRRLVYLCPPDQPVTVAMVSPSVLALAIPTDAKALDLDSDLTLSRHVDEVERRLITAALARARGKRTSAARLLGISRYGLTLKMQRLGISE
jgi:two-component system response regulator HupR/HoxA